MYWDYILQRLAVHLLSHSAAPNFLAVVVVVAAVVDSIALRWEEVEAPTDYS